MLKCCKQKQSGITRTYWNLSALDTYVLWYSQNYNCNKVHVQNATKVVTKKWTLLYFKGCIIRSPDLTYLHWEYMDLYTVGQPSIFFCCSNFFCPVHIISLTLDLTFFIFDVPRGVRSNPSNPSNPPSYGPGHLYLWPKVLPRKLFTKDGQISGYPGIFGGMTPLLLYRFSWLSKPKFLFWLLWGLCSRVRCLGYKWNLTNFWQKLLKQVHKPGQLTYF